MRKIFIFSLLVLLLFAAACTQPVAAVPESSPGVYETAINIPDPGSLPSLKISSNLPGMLRAIGYSGQDFISGTVQYSRTQFAPVINVQYPNVSITQNYSAKVDAASPDFLNLWKLKLSDNRPFSLAINNAQAEGHWNLSGLPITGLNVEAGAGKNAFTTDELNPGEMQDFDLKGSSGDVTIEGIMNSRCHNMSVTGVDGALTLRFNGVSMDPKLDVKITGGKGVIKIAVSQTVPSHIRVQGTGAVTYSGGIQKITSGSGEVYINQNSQENSEPVINIDISETQNLVSLETLN